MSGFNRRFGNYILFFAKRVRVILLDVHRTEYTQSDFLICFLWKAPEASFESMGKYSK